MQEKQFNPNFKNQADITHDTGKVQKQKNTKDIKSENKQLLFLIGKKNQDINELDDLIQERQ